MKKISLILLFLVLRVSFSAGQDTLLLFHPTAYNIEVIKSLADDRMLDLDGYHVLGVYHALEAYDYNEARKFLQEEADHRFSLYKVEGELDLETLFDSNGCTKDFYSLFSCSRGSLFMGGPDIPPAVYNESVHLLTSVTDPYRHYMEASFLFHLLGGSQQSAWAPYMNQDKKYLVSGICLGMQTMNVATGGSMIQDIPTELYGVWTAEEVLLLPGDQMHRNYSDMLAATCEEPTSYHFHQIQCLKGSFLRKKMHYRGEFGPLVLSSHHQAADVMGKGLIVSATSMDGRIVEAIEHEDFPNVLGVQFHPEKPGLFDPSISHLKSCGMRINFQEVIRDTKSWGFHSAYWNYLGDILRKNRR